jgi:putative salt-induced outer membrane protein YdiY
MHRNWAICLASVVIVLVSVVAAFSDEVHLRNGDHLSGQVVTMEEGRLLFETSYAGVIAIEWEEVVSLKTEGQMEIVLTDASSFNGTVTPADEGMVKIQVGPVAEAASVALLDVRAINPAKEPAVTITARGNAGLSVAKGNTKTENYHLDGQFIARTLKNRFTAFGEYNRSEDGGEETADNALGFLKYDHFLSPKWYAYGNTSFETDDFKDLDLRSVLGAGVGHQIWETPLKNLAVEVGVAYVNEDFDKAEDEDYSAGRWSIGFDHYLLKNAVQFFHFDEGFVGLEDTSDMFIRTRTGFRIPLYRGITATAQYNLDWDNSPSPGNDKTDHMYLFTLGYQLDR